MHLPHHDSSSWEVIDQKEVPQVTQFYDDSEVQIVSISSQDIAASYTFDVPCSSSGSSSSSSPRTRSKLLKVPGSPSKGFSFRLSRSPSPSSSYYEDDESEWDSAPNPNLFRDPRDFTPLQARDALVSARSQLLASSDLRKLGGNILFSEGWTITKMKKGNRYRLQVRYTARPARANLRPGASKAALIGLPPFMDLLEGTW